MMKINKYIFWKKAKSPKNIRTIYDSITSSAQVKKIELERKIRMMHCGASQSVKSLLTRPVWHVQLYEKIF